MALTVGQNHGADKGKWDFAFAFAMMTLFSFPILLTMPICALNALLNSLASVVFLTCLNLTMI